MRDAVDREGVTQRTVRLPRYKPHILGGRTGGVKRRGLSRREALLESARKIARQGVGAGQSITHQGTPVARPVRKTTGLRGLSLVEMAGSQPKTDFGSPLHPSPGEVR